MLYDSAHTLLSALTEIGTPKSLSLALMVRYKDFSGFPGLLAPKPVDYLNHKHFLLDAQAFALVSKCKTFVVPGVDPKAAALKSWYAAEHQCYKTNERLSPFLFASFDENELGIYSFIERVRKKIVCWVGSHPPGLDDIRGRFGPGATYSDKGRLTTIPDKISSISSFTAQAYWYLLPYVQTKWGREASLSGRHPIVVLGNRYASVPKNWKTNRGIGIEPSINLYYQLGLGTALRSRLAASTGWDLRHAQEHHRQSACDASVSEKFATLDLSSASDTVCSNLVKLLMPPAWYAELKALRSPKTFVEGKWVHLEKFSSMGNGYTFELETIIFAAISSAWLESCGALGVLGHDVMVYGDDIIIPTEFASGLQTVLRFFGFLINYDKSFVAGPFRESCGADFWRGEDVRPFFRKVDADSPDEILVELNGWRSFCLKVGIDHSAPSSHWSKLRNCLPIPLRNLYGPSELGDIVIHSDPSRWRYRWKHSIRYFKAYSPISKPLRWEFWSPEVVLACALYGVGDGLRGVVPRKPVLSYKVRDVPFS